MEALADLLGVDREGFLATIAEWNTQCAKGEDDTMWGYKKEWMFPIENAPFYGTLQGGAVQGTGCGILVDTSMQALDSEGHPIPGLYVGFQTAGGQDGNNAMEARVHGTVGITYVGGYMASEGILANER